MGWIFNSTHIIWGCHGFDGIRGLTSAVGFAPYSFEVAINANENKNNNVEVSAFEANLFNNNQRLAALAL